MGTIENVQVYSKRRDEGWITYAMFLEWEGLRFCQIWGLADNIPWGEDQNTKTVWRAAARQFLDQARAEFEQDPESLRKIGSPASEVLPDWIYEGWTELDW